MISSRFRINSSSSQIVSQPDRLRRRSTGYALLLPTALAVGALWYAGGSLAASPADQTADQDIRAQFRNPEKRYRPMVRWWWPGNDVKDAELRREVGELDDAGFGGAEIQSYSMNFKADMSPQLRERLYQFGTPSFFSHVRSAVDEARARGLWIDLSFGSGWPFGGGVAITPERAITELTFSDTPMKGGSKFQGKLQLPELGSSMSKNISAALGVPPTSLPPGWEERLKLRAKTIAVIAVRGTAPTITAGDWQKGLKPTVATSGQIDIRSTVDLTSRVAADGTLAWDVPDGNWRLFVFRQVAMDSAVIGSADAGPKLILDHFQRAAFDAFSKQFGEPLQAALTDRLGDGLRAVFCDSLEIPTDFYWSDDFLAEFRKRRGYDLTPLLPLILRTGYNNPYEPAILKPQYDSPVVGDAVRRDYWATVNELIIERLYRPFGDWAKSLKLKTRVQAHGAPADLLHVYGLADIPETESLYNSGTSDFMRMAGSAGDIYGRKVIASESFAYMGDAYSMTPQQFKADTDRSIVAGVNQIVYHGYPYVYDDRPYPGWGPFSNNSHLSFSNFMNARNTFWPYISALNAYITRLQFISQIGETAAPIAILSSRTGYNQSYVNPPLTDNLVNSGYAFSHLNADGLLRSRIERNELVAPGGARFSAILLNEVTWLDPKVATRLAQIGAASIPVIVIGAAPNAGATYKSLKADSEVVSAAVAKLLATPKARQVGSAEAAVSALRALVRPTLEVASGNSLPFIEKRVGALRMLFVSNPNADAVTRDVEVDAAGSPQLWDAWTGEVKPFTDFQNLSADRKRLRLSLPPYGSALVVLDPAVKHAPQIESVSAAMATELPVGSVGWKLHAVGYGIDGQPATVDHALSALTDWSKLSDLKSFSGRGTYTTEIDIPAGKLIPGTAVQIDLGDVKDVAEITINGQRAPTLFMQPYVADISGLVHAGKNSLQIVVVNSLSNSVSPRPPVITASEAEAGSLLGSLKPIPYSPKPAGLIGPVVLRINP